MKTNQELFNFVWQKITEQGKKSAEVYSCLYRGPDGTKCAIGHMISNEVAIRCNSLDILSAIKNEAFLKSLKEFCGDNFDLDFLKRLQRCHDNTRKDNSFFIVDFTRNMMSLAQDYNLTFPSKNP